MDKFDQRNVELLPRTMEMMSDTELTQYYIQSWSLDHRDNDTNNLPGEVGLRKLQYQIYHTLFTRFTEGSKDGDSV